MHNRAVGFNEALAAEHDSSNSGQITDSPFMMQVFPGRWIPYLHDIK